MSISSNQKFRFKTVLIFVIKILLFSFNGLTHVQIGNLLTFFFGSQIGWATINFLEFQSVNSTLPTGQLTLDESSLVISLVNVGGFIGNFAILPIGQLFGIKRTIHLFVLPSIVSNTMQIVAVSFSGFKGIFRLFFRS